MDPQDLQLSIDDNKPIFWSKSGVYYVDLTIFGNILPSCLHTMIMKSGHYWNLFKLLVMDNIYDLDTESVEKI